MQSAHEEKKTKTTTKMAMQHELKLIETRVRTLGISAPILRTRKILKRNKLEEPHTVLPRAEIQHVDMGENWIRRKYPAGHRNRGKWQCRLNKCPHKTKHSPGYENIYE